MGRLSGLPLVSLIMFVVFVIFAMMLLVYYVARLIMLFLGAAMSPFVVLLWLLPGFRDFANNLIRTYLMVIFVLLVHVVILMLGATLLDGQNSGGVPNPIMVITIGIATLFLLLKSQSVLIQMSVVSSGANQTRKLGTQFANGMRYTGDKIEASAGKQLVDLRSRYAVSMLKAAK
jgi:type IV secretory pathway TrbL component